MCPSRFHFPTPLGSTVVTRFIATMGALTPALLLPAPRQVSLITERAFPDIPSPTTPCAPVFRRYFLFRAGLAPDSLCLAIGGSSDFAQWSQSHQSHQAVSSLCRGRMTRPSVLRTIFSFPVALHIPSAVCSYFQLVAGSSATEGLSPSHARSLSSARPRPVPGRSGLITLTARIFSNTRRLHTCCARGTGRGPVFESALARTPCGVHP